jgi:hypothetical protein
VATSFEHNAYSRARNAEDVLTIIVKWLSLKQRIIIRTEVLVCAGLHGEESSRTIQTRSFDRWQPVPMDGIVCLDHAPNLPSNVRSESDV